MATSEYYLKEYEKLVEDEVENVDNDLDNCELKLFYLTNAIELNLFNYEARMKRGMEHYFNSNFKLALYDFEICFNNNYEPKQAALYFALGLVDSKYTKHYQQAYRCFNLGEINDYPMFYDKYGFCLLEIGFHKKAVYYLEKYLKENTETHEVYYDLARALYKVRNHNKGLAMINKALELRDGCGYFYKELKTKIESELATQKELTSTIV